MLVLSQKKKGNDPINKSPMVSVKGIPTFIPSFPAEHQQGKSGKHRESTAERPYQFLRDGRRGLETQDGMKSREVWS